MLRSILSLAAVVVMSAAFILPRVAHAEESATNQVKDAAGDANTKVKKVARHTKKKVKKATGQDTVVDDAKDTMHDATDAGENAADKAKRQ